MPTDPVERFIEAARAHGRKVKRQGAHWLVSCPGPSHAHGDRNPSLHVSYGRKGDCVLKCYGGDSPESIVEPLGLTMADLFVETPASERVLPAAPVHWLTDDYVYSDELGTALYRVRRFEGIDLSDGRHLKTFRQQRLDGATWSNSLGGLERTLYRLPELAAGIAAGRAAWIVEGEKDVETMRRLGKVATTAGAASAWRAELAAHFAGASAVTVVADRDAPGFEVARRIAADLEAAGVPVRVMVPPAPAKDVTELVEAGREIAELEPLDADAEPPAVEVDDEVPTRRLRLESLEGLKVRPVRWLWHQRIALGQIALLAGKEGIGKSTVALELVAKVTRGTLDGAYLGEPRDVVIVATEDSFEHTIGPRLMAADADLSRVFRVTMVEEYAALAFPRDLPALEDACAGRDVGLIVLDPLMSRVGAELDTHRDQQVRQALEPIGALADRLRASVLGLIHLNKGATVDPLDKIMASKAFTAVARSVLYGIRDREVPTRYLLGLVKSNLGPGNLPTFTYTIDAKTVAETDEGPVIASFVVWGEPTDRQIDEVLATQPGAESKEDAAARWLTDFLCKSGPLPASAIFEAGEHEGYAKWTLQRARPRAGVVMEKRAVVGIAPVPYWRLDKVDPDAKCVDVASRADAPARTREGSDMSPGVAWAETRSSRRHQVTSESDGRGVSPGLDDSMFDD